MMRRWGEKMGQGDEEMGRGDEEMGRGDEEMGREYGARRLGDGAR